MTDYDVIFFLNVISEVGIIKYERKGFYHTRCSQLQYKDTVIETGEKVSLKTRAHILFL